MDAVSATPVIEAITHTFVELSKKPLKELFDRSLFHKQLSDDLQKYAVIVIHKYYIETKCEYTYDGLLCTLLGCNPSEKTHQICGDSNEKKNEELHTILLNNKEALLAEQAGDFFAYGFQLQPIETCLRGPDYQS